MGNLMIPISQVRKTGSEMLRLFFQGHTANKWWSLDLNSVYSDPRARRNKEGIEGGREKKRKEGRRTLVLVLGLCSLHHL